MKLSQPGRAARTVAAAGLILFGVGVSHMVAQTYPLYQEPWRPQFHFSQPNLFMNDPNGLVYYDGEWHLFYQSRPGGGIVWGHAVSKDLLHWQNLPIAIPRQPDGKSIFSGSVVIDKDNTSGFGTAENPAMVAIYTASGAGNQSQALAYSLDRGRTFTFYSGNPVIDIGSSQFRDPKVFWHGESKRWVMVVALPDDHQVAIYGSPNLRQWELLSKWGPLPPFGGQYEVPDLFPLNLDGNASRARWVMIISTNPGGLWGGSQTAAYIGDFDGRTFKEDARYSYAGAPGTTTFTDFEREGHAPWTATGTAFGAGPTQGALAGQPLVNGYKGQRLPTPSAVAARQSALSRPKPSRSRGATSTSWSEGRRRQRRTRQRSTSSSTARQSAPRPVTGATRSIGSRGTLRNSLASQRRSKLSTTTRRRTVASTSMTSASRILRHCRGTIALPGSTGAKTTMPASRSTALPMAGVFSWVGSTTGSTRSPMAPRRRSGGAVSRASHAS